MKSMQNPKVAVVIKGYYESKDNPVFGIYLLDRQNVMMIPFDEEMMSETETVDTMADTVHFLRKQGYNVHYDFRDETVLDVTKFYPTIQKINN